MRVLRSWGYSLMGTRCTLVALIVEMGDNHFTFPCHIRNYSLQRNLKYLPRILLFLTECFLLSFCSQGSGGSALKKKNNNPLYNGNFQIGRGGEASGAILLFLPHPAHILSASEQEGEGRAPRWGGASQPASLPWRWLQLCVPYSTCWGVTLR